MQWLNVCNLEDILPGTGVCALVHGEQVALFRIGERVYATGNRDPFTRANVLSRGLTGSYGERLKVVSPLLKHAFDLETGVSLDDPGMRLRTYPVRLQGDQVLVGIDPQATTPGPAFTPAGAGP